MVSVSKIIPSPGFIFRISTSHTWHFICISQEKNLVLVNLYTGEHLGVKLFLCI